MQQSGREMKTCDVKLSQSKRCQWAVPPHMGRSLPCQLLPQSEEPQVAPVCSLLLHKQTFLPVSKTQKLSIGWEPSSFQQATDVRLPRKTSLHQETQLTPTAQGNSANTTNLNHHQGEHLSSPHQDVSRIFSSHYLKWRLWLQILLVIRVLTLPPTCIQCEHCTAAPWEMQPAENHLCTSTSAAETTAECS